MKVRLQTAAFLFSLVSCYSPQLDDCTLRCEAATDCAGGQTCGSDHLCAATDIAGHCSQLLSQDASVGDGGPIARPSDASTLDAGRPVDAGPQVIAHLHDDGMGAITTNTGDVCDAQGSGHGDCMVEVAAGVPLTLQATGEASQVFQQWSGQACTGTSPSCTFTPTMPTTDIHAMFAPPKM